MSSPAAIEPFRAHLLEGRVNLKDLLPEELEHFFSLLGQPRFRAGQVLRWMYVRGVSDFDQMTDLSKDLRARLREIALVPNLEVDGAQLSETQDTSKYLFRLPDSSLVESVRMRYLENLGPGRVAVCISPQVGCAMACDFCASGLLGLKRNLATWEIVDQVTQIQNRVRDQGERVANVVFMGIGEPLHNYRNLLRALRLINLAEGLAIGMRHLTVSTAGLVPGILKLAEERLAISLAISLHAPDDELRSRMMPINRRWPLEKLLEACREYQRLTERRVTFEYLMIDGVNDSREQARRLASLLQGMHALVNLIPWNPVEGVEYRRSTRAAVRAFQAEVEEFGIKCTVRQEKGSDIEAACGQLRLREMDWKAPAQSARAPAV